MNEIKRILKTDGILLARVASVNDFNFGAGVGEEREKNFYFEGDYTKRFFDLEDVNRYFGIIGSVEAEETSMTRDEEEYSKSKILYKVKVMNISRSGYYKWLKTKDILNQYKINRRDLGKLIKEIHKEKPSYGYHRINVLIKRKTGWVVSDNLVHKVCKILKNWRRINKIP